jgi:uncharacterized protein
MFPLGIVLFPGIVLPLHVFEPRYRALVRTCLDGDGDFGVVLIERGSEVGGNDVRTDVGTSAHILQAEELQDGRWVVAAVGTRRLRVHSWLPDDPYPRATIEDWPDAPPASDLSPSYTDDKALLRRVLALKAELGEPAAPALTELSDDPVLGSYQLAAVAPFGPADQQAVLVADTAEMRLELVAELLTEEVGYLEQRIAMG